MTLSKKEIEWVENNRNLIDSKNMPEIFKSIGLSFDLNRSFCKKLYLVISILADDPSVFSMEIQKEGDKWWIFLIGPGYGVSINQNYLESFISDTGVANRNDLVKRSAEELAEELDRRLEIPKDLSIGFFNKISNLRITGGI